jgi:hypothetical protein
VSNRQVVLGVVGAALIVTGLLALWFPVHVGQYDQWGMQISCGRGLNASLSQTPGAHDAGLAGQCGTALLLRRLWAIPAAVTGWVLVTVLAAIWVRSTPDDSVESTRFWELRGDAT